MNKREFLRISALSGIGMGLFPEAMGQFNRLSQLSTFVVPSLGFSYDALQPFIDEETMRVHHSKHFQGYTDKLNQAVLDKSMEGKSIEFILQHVEESDVALRNNGGGYYNHKMFFASLSPDPKPSPEGKLLALLEANFGSMEAFKEKFSNAAASVFGSGWTWLVFNTQGQLEIISTPNQDNPLMSNVVKETGIPILGIDVWEHAYYLHYQNKRSEYLVAFWKVLDWKFVEEQFEKLSG